jgi:tRNA (guanosine-2'-O-)-methyltransferase
MRKNLQNQQHQQILKQFGPAEIIERLTPYVTERRQQRIQQVLDQRLDSIQLAIEAPCDIRNALACIRSAEALGVNKIHIIKPEGTVSGWHGTTQGAYYWVEVHYYPDLNSFINYVHQHNILLAGAFPEANNNLNDLPIEKPLCIIIGNEQRGLTDAAKAACDIHYTIPMFGMTESFNLSVSAAISLFDITKRKRAALNSTGDLPAATRLKLQAKFFLRSVKPRLVAGLFNNGK